MFIFTTLNPSNALKGPRNGSDRAENLGLKLESQSVECSFYRPCAIHSDSSRRGDNTGKKQQRKPCLLRNELSSSHRSFEEEHVCIVYNQFACLFVCLFPYIRCLFLTDLVCCVHIYGLLGRCWLQDRKSV